MLIGPISISLFELPFTLQTLVICVTAYYFGWISVLACVVYVGFGLSGLPVFSGFASNPGILKTISAGFVIGFPIMAGSIGGLKNQIKLTYLKVFLLFILAHIILISFAGLYNVVAGLDFPTTTYILKYLTPSLLIKSGIAGFIIIGTSKFTAKVV